MNTLPPADARRLAGDLTIVAMVLDELRHRALGRVFGLPQADANVMTA